MIYSQQHIVRPLILHLPASVELPSSSTIFPFPSFYFSPSHPEAEITYGRKKRSMILTYCLKTPSLRRQTGYLAAGEEKEYKVAMNTSRADRTIHRVRYDRRAMYTTRLAKRRVRRRDKRTMNRM
jgi:hypothetical protein